MGIGRCATAKNDWRQNFDRSGGDGSSSGAIYNKTLTMVLLEKRKKKNLVSFRPWSSIFSYKQQASQSSLFLLWCLAKQEAERAKQQSVQFSKVFYSSSYGSSGT